MAGASRATINSKRKIENDNNTEVTTRKLHKTNKHRLPNAEILETKYLNRMMKDLGIKINRDNAPKPNLNTERRMASKDARKSIDETSINEVDQEEKWETDKRQHKITRVRSNSNTSVESNTNRFSSLNPDDNMETNTMNTRQNTQERHASKTYKASCPPLS
ncbi:hypothetical protein PV326_008092 [Microctonus aethiopoides]|nr:hypothetical protein PV326_008092 [Microctonus aethiopoides]